MSAPHSSDTERHGPLVGTRVVELATVVMAPYAGQILAGLGADVIKVEDAAGDGSRKIGGGEHPHLSGVALNLHANKRSICLDLKHETGRDVMTRLLATADLLITNLRPKALARLGLTYDDVASINPRLVYCRAGGFRSDSADADRPVYDDLVQAQVGLPALNEKAGSGMRFMPTAIADKVTGLALVNAALAALLHRASSGRGQRVEVPMFDTMLGFNLVEHLAAATFPGGQPGYSRVLSAHRGPHRTSDGWIALMPYTDAHWRALYSATGREHLLSQPWHRSHSERLRQADAVYAELAELVATQTTAHWLRLCEELDVPAAAVPSLAEIVDEPSRHRGVLRDAQHPVIGPYRAIRQSTIFSATPADDHRPAPLVGEHGEEILRELGYDSEAIAAIAAGGDSRS